MAYDSKSLHSVMSLLYAHDDEADEFDKPMPWDRPMPEKVYDLYLSVQDSERLKDVFEGHYPQHLDYYDPMNDPEHQRLHELGIGDLVTRKPVLVTHDGYLSPQDILEAVTFYQLAYGEPLFTVMKALGRTRENLKEAFNLLDSLAPTQQGIIFLNHGCHWTALSRGVEDGREEDLYYYFDPFGHPPPPEIGRWLRRKMQYDYNDEQYQTGDIECGMHCIVHALQKRAGSDRRMRCYRDYFFRQPTDAEAHLGAELAEIKDE